MFEDRTYENLLEEALALAPSGIDTRQGSIYRDALTGPILALATIYSELENLVSLTRVDTAVDEYLDDKGEEYGVDREPATVAKYRAILDGENPEEGEEFIADDLTFGLYYDDEGNPYFECETVGTEGNYVTEGTTAMPVNNLDNLYSAEFGELIEAAVDAQTDDDYREDIEQRLSFPAENGNKQHFKEWCESVSGVGFAKIIPLWNGPNTVKGVIYSADGLAASASVVSAVQAYVDPDEDGDGEGDGLGEGAAEIGCHFTAVAPTAFNVTVSAIIVLADGYTIDTVESAVRAAIENYLKTLTEENLTGSGAVIRYNQISSIIMDAEGVLDHQNLLLNGDTANVQPRYDQYAVLSTMNITNGPFITTQPANASAIIDSTARFSVVARGDNLTYRWQWAASGSDTWENSDLSGSSSANLNFIVPSADFNGRRYRCVVTASGTNSIISDEATLTVTAGS